MARVLVIDDDVEIVSILLEVLSHDGHQTASAGDPAEGLRQARAFAPDLIVLDYHMPGDTGAHLFESLRRNNATKATPILFMSGEADPAHIFAEISDASGSRFLAKPVKLDDFRRTLNEMLGGSKTGGSSMGKLVLVRHGQSQWNLENRFTGWVDVPITELGAQEAARAGQALKGIAFDLAFTSALTRAQQTLDIILRECGRTGIPIERSQALNERHYGDLQGLNKAETAQKYGDAQVHQWRRSYDIKPPNGESLKDTAARTLPYFNEKILPQAAAGRKVLVAAHGNSLRAIVMGLEKLSAEQILKVEIGTCKPIVYDIGPKGEVLKKSEESFV